MFRCHLLIAFANSLDQNHDQQNVAHDLDQTGLTSWLSFVVSSVSLSLSHWYPGSGVVLDCIDS